MYVTVLNLSASLSLPPSLNPVCCFHHVTSPLNTLSVLTDKDILFQNVSGSGKDMGQAYVNFTRNCMDQIRSKVNDELWILNFFEVLDMFCWLSMVCSERRGTVGEMWCDVMWHDVMWCNVICLLQQWYTAQIQLLCNWLSERLDHSLHLYQCTCLAHVVKVSVRNIHCVPFVFSQRTAGLSHRKPASAMTSLDNCHAQGNDKTDTVCFNKE